MIETIARSGADLVLSTLVGADEVAFERQRLAMNLRGRCRTLSLVLDESTRERIGDAAAAGLWTAFGYFQQLPTAENRAFPARYHDAFGSWAPPVSTLSESTYSRAAGERPARRPASDPPAAPPGRSLRRRLPPARVRALIRPPAGSWAGTRREISPRQKRYVDNDLPELILHTIYTRSP